jgi:hypothetical protein
MMRLPRPHIPLAVRCFVVERQLIRFDQAKVVETLRNIRPMGMRLKVGIEALKLIFGWEAVHLDHQPALALRKLNRRTGMYTPDANDPDHLLYREADAHRIKTLVRGDGAQFSDRALIKRQKRQARKADPMESWVTMKRRSAKRKLRSRSSSWPKRKLRSRSSWSKQPR